jgi:Fe-S-cluster containining protein
MAADPQIETEPLPQCRRCGQCCEKGGPSLHLADRLLVEEGKIPLRHLFTIRRGELARDNVKGILAPLTDEIIKIKGQTGRWTCRYYDPQERGCQIYDYRPLECRVLDCRDTRRIEQVYATDRLTRRDLLSSLPGLWELIEDHDRRCSYASLAALVGAGAADGDVPKEEGAILETMRYDAHIRKLSVEKGGLEAGTLDFVFGRPLDQTIRMFDIQLVRRGDGFGLVLGRRTDDG